MFISRLDVHIGEKFEEQGTRLQTYRLALEDFRRFDGAEDDEIARLSPRELVRQNFFFVADTLRSKLIFPTLKLATKTNHSLDIRIVY